ncbi:MAG: ATP-dependent RNA helicase HrpA [Magnetococcales bacterium]|nr:ATP-dependent RNA helicase HrpA [Magnetococcales bacterium]
MNDSPLPSSTHATLFRQWQQIIRELSQQIDATLVKDRYRLRRRLAHYRKERFKESLPFPALEQLARKVAVARQCYAERLERFPVPRYTLALPIVEQGEEIKRLIHDHQVIVICSATGSGKTTQIPKLCLELKRGSAGFIGMTQPRRIAARSLATFLANDLGCKVGDWVGYKMRFADQVQSHSLIKIMTDGLLLAELQHDPLLLHYDTLIVDEAHERSLNIDFLLGHLQRILPKRPDLKLIIASATLDHDKFSRHFGGAPVLSIPGKSYPVEVRYRPPHPEENEEAELDLTTTVLHTIRHLHHSGAAGDVLVFLPGEADIREMSVSLRKMLQASHEILPVHARLASRDQDRIFTPGSKPRIILATNVAETSLTVPGICHVIDPGLAKIKRQDVRGSIQRLVLEKISRASADQRKGRCGRTAPGVCIRLYSEEDYEARPAFTDPEIVRTSLAAIILGMKAQGIGAIDEFPFMDPPSQAAVLEGWRLLAELKAVDSHNHLTSLGKQLARLPIDPRLGRMILEAPALQCLDEILIIASALSIPDPREWPLNRSTQAEELHGRFVDKNSDFLTLLNLWQHIEALRHASRSKTAFHNALKGELIAASRVREWWEIYAQLKKITKEMGYPSAPAAEQRYAPIHKAILAGHVGMIGLKKIKNEYAGCRNTSFHIHPGSALFKKSPTWIVAAELVETSRLYARVCARVEPEWIEAAAGSACKRDYYEASWEKKSGQVMALEKVSYSGLPLIMNRKVPFGPIDPNEARRIFIQEALVGNRLSTQATFLLHNQSLIQEIRDKEHKTRRRDLLIQEAELFALYDRLVPPTTYCARHFHNWYFHAVKHNPQLLHFERHELLRLPDQPSLQEQFPGHLTIDGQTFSLEYHFNPGAGEDGISVRIPLAALSQCSASRFEWLVPGMLSDKVTAMLKALPKSWRKPLVPVPETVALCLQHLDPAQGVPLTVALTRILKEFRGVDIPARVWRDLELPDHWLMNFMIIGEDSGKVIQQGRDLEKLKTQWGPLAQKEFQTLSKPGLEQHGLTRWTFGDLPQQIEINTEAGLIIGFPALVDRGQSVSLQVFDNAEQAQSMRRRGLIRLLALNLPQQVRQLKTVLHFSPGAILMPLPTGAKKSLTSEIIDFVIDRVFLHEAAQPITTRDLFQQRLQEGQKHLFPEAQRIKAILDAIHSHYRTIQLHLKTQNANPGLKPILPEIKEQLDHLIYPDFLWQTPFLWLKEYPRYLQAILKRIERRTFAPMKDSEKANRIKEFYGEFLKIQANGSALLDHNPELERLRWMLEEFRVSLFAQELGTVVPVSEKRLREQINLVV